jgi:phage terminase small subunit
MGRPRKPVESHIDSGTYRPSRHGPRPDPDEVTPPPAKPDGLDPLADAMWDRLARQLVGVVRDRDAAVLEQMCRWWSRWQEVEEVLSTRKPGTNGYTQLLVASGICSDKFDRLASRFGLTPADRAKIRAEVVVKPRAKVATRPPTKLDKQGPPKQKGKP